jgi:hypothetical protein
MNGAAFSTPTADFEFSIRLKGSLNFEELSIADILESLLSSGLCLDSKGCSRWIHVFSA